MPFVKGKSGNPSGRPRYSASDEIRVELNKRGTNLVQMIFETIDNTNDPEVRLYALFKLMDFKYSKPKELELDLEHAVEIVKRAIEQRRTGEFNSGTLPNLPPAI